MAIKFIDILEPVNPAASAIAKSKQIAGARSVATRADLDTIIPQVLSASYNPADGSHENDAIGQVWYVADENKYYKLTEFSVGTNTSPFTITRKWELFIDSSITASAIDNRIVEKLRTSVETQTIFGYDTLTGQQVNSNSIYVGGFGDYDGIMIQSNGKFFDFPANNDGTLATQNYVNDYVNDTKLNINDNINSKIELLQNEIDSSVVKFENINEDDSVNTVVSNADIKIEESEKVISGNIVPVEALLKDFTNYDSVKLKSIKHYAANPNVTKNVNIAEVYFCNGAHESGASTLPLGWECYNDKSGTSTTTELGSVYRYDTNKNCLVNGSNWQTPVLEADITCVGTSNYYQNFEYIDTAIQEVTFDFEVINYSDNTQNIFYITSAGVDNLHQYSIAVGNSYNTPSPPAPCISIGYVNSEIGIHSNPRDYATFQPQAAGTGDWTILNTFSNVSNEALSVSGTLRYTIIVGKGRMSCSVVNATTGQEYTFADMPITDFKFRYFGFMSDGLNGSVGIRSISATVNSVPVYAHVYKLDNGNTTYLGSSNNYVTVSDDSSELIWNFDNLSIPLSNVSLYTKFTTSVNYAGETQASVNLLTYTTDDNGFGLLLPNNINPTYLETAATEYTLSIYDSSSTRVYADDKTILTVADNYTKSNNPIATPALMALDANKIGGQISIPFVNGSNETFALLSDINSIKSEINLQDVVDNQGTESVVLNTILTIAKNPVEDVHPLLMFGDFSSRIGSVYYPNPGQSGRITGFINETVRNPDGSFTTTNIVAGAPLTLTDGTEDNHAATVGQVNQMISSAISSSGTSNEIRYIFENPEIVPVNEEAIWNTVIKYKNAAGIAGIDYTNVPIVQVYSKVTGEICYPCVNLVAVTENNENYTCVNIIFRPITETITASQYTAVIMTSAEIV